MSEPLTLPKSGHIESTDITECEESKIEQAFDTFRTKLSQIHALNPLTTPCIKLAKQRLLSWADSLDVDPQPVAQQSAGQIGSALSIRDTPRWRPTLAREDTGDAFPQGDRSPISLLSMDCTAPESSTRDTERHQEQTDELADLSVPSNHDTEHEQATFEAVPPSKGHTPTVNRHGSFSNLQQCAQDPPDSTRSENLQVEPRDTLDVQADEEGEERSDQTDCFRDSLGQAPDSAPELALSVEGRQHVAQPRVEVLSDKGNEDAEDESFDGDEEDEEEQTEHVEEEEIASSAGNFGVDDDEEPEAAETLYTEPKLTQDEKGSQEDTRRARASSSVRLAGGVSNPHDVLRAGESVNVQSTASSAVPISHDHVVSAPVRGSNHETEIGQVISNDLVAIGAYATEEQAEHIDPDADQRDAVERARSHHSGGVCDKDEIVVANVLQRGPRSNGRVVDPQTKDRPDTDDRVDSLTDAYNSSTDNEDDFDNIDPTNNTSNNVRPRAKRASSGEFSVSETPKKRRKTLVDLTEQTTCSAVKKISDSLIQPPQVYQLIAGMLDKSHEDDTKPLVSFFFTIGSPFAIQSFRDTCRQVRNVQVSGPFPEETGARRSTRALDHIGMHDKVSPILRRYHLVKLVDRLSELQQESSRALSQQEPKKLKYGLRRQLPSKALVGPKGAASEALKRLLREAYPETLQTTEIESTRYNQQSKELNNRLSAGRNWHALPARFGIGALALLPVGKEVGVWNSNIEKAQHGVFAQVLDLLHEHRGDALLKLGQAVSESIFDGLLGAPGAPSFVFDDDDDDDDDDVERNQLNEAPYDSPALVGRFRLQSV